MLSVVLVNPKYSGNIGSVARAMANFGFKSLYYIGDLQQKDAGLMAVHAKGILQKAKKIDSFDDLRSNFDFLIATTGIDTSKDDRFHRLPVSPKDLTGKLKAVKGKMALVFGPEDIGLSNDELEQCDLLVRIPTSRAYPIMNLSHAAALILYELSGLKNPTIRIATAKELQLIYDELDSIYGKTSVQKKEVVGLIVRRILARAVLSGREAHTLLGLLKDIDEGLE